MSYFPRDTLRRIIMVVLILLGFFEITRGSFWWIIDWICAATFSPKIMDIVSSKFKK
jgi:hypothetical protein